MTALRYMLSAAVVAAAGLLGRASAPDALWTLTMDAADTAAYCAPALGNGHTGVVMDRCGLKAQRMFQASVHDDGTPGRVSTIVPVMVPLALSVDVDGDTATVFRRQQLRMREAEAVTDFTVGGVRFTATYMAVRHMPHCVMVALKMTADRDATVTVVNRPEIPASLAEGSVSPVTIWCEGDGLRLLRCTATYNHGRGTLAASAHLQGETGNWLTVSADTLRVRLRAGETAMMWGVASQCSTADFADPYNEADRQAIYASKSGWNEMLSRHREAWRDLYRSRVEVLGDSAMARLVNSALYNLYSSVRAGSRRSIAPMGLTSDKYYGHVFWDADTWILPVLLRLHPELARSMLDYRYDALPAARRRAAAYGYRGAMFPWESDHNGEESTPTFALTGPMEHHITADVGRGVWLYFKATGDTAWLRSEGYELLRDCADFWVSRAEATSGGRFTVRNVVGADEYAIGVDGNAFTNAAARRVLEYAADAAEVLGVKPDARWREVASGMEFPMMPDGVVFREHESYGGEMTKQADVELLAYPLEIMTDPNQIRANIDYYAGRIDSVGGPAMSHAAMAVNYIRMGDYDRASALIDRAVRPYLRGAFLSLAETPSNNETYFMTAAGGLLQAIIFGYCDNPSSKSRISCRLVSGDRH